MLCKKSLLGSLLFFLGLGVNLPARAGLDSEAASQTVQALEKENWKQAWHHASASGEPLLKKLYYWYVFQERNGEGSFVDLARFIRQNPSWPGQESLRTALEYRIRGDSDAGQVIRWFEEYPPLTAKGVDYYAQALIRLRRMDALESMLSDWWAGTLMSRDDQIFIYGRYRQYIPVEAHRRRFDKLLFNRRYTNARAVAKVLGHGYPALAEARIALAEQKNGVDGLIDRVPAHLKDDPGLAYERLRWRRRKGLDLNAIEILRNPPPIEKIANLEDWWRERHILIRRMLEKGRYEGAYLLAESHKQKEGFAYAQAEWLAGWLALEYMNRPQEALERFVALSQNVSTPVSLARAYYWAGKAEEALNRHNKGQPYFDKAVQYQTVFYGQLAGKQQDMRQALSYARPPQLSPADISRYDANEMTRLSMLYYRAGLKKQAIGFLNHFVRYENSAKAYRYSLDVASYMKRYNDVIRLAKEATRKGFFITLQSYPKASQYVSQRNRSVELALVYSLIRQESQFDVDAHSPVGALGLMQLMPGTAKLVARSEGSQYVKGWLTSRPEYNVKLGSRYLHDLLRRYDGDYVMAIAAYNAGPGRVDRWITQFGDPRRGEISYISWIELMPIYETRNYVQRVLEGLYVYRLLLGKDNLARTKFSLF